jgi:hypothetical protein
MGLRDPLTGACHDLPARLTRAELALLWRVSLRTIERYEAIGVGPQPIRVGGRVLYRREDVLAWEQAQIDGAAD